MNFAYVQPIFCPTDDMFTRNSKSVNSFYDYYEKMGYNFQCVFGGYCLNDKLWNDISELIAVRSKNTAKVIRFDKNYGKAYVVNKLTQELIDVDYFLTADSDIIFKIDEPNLIERLFESFQYATSIRLNPSLIALMQEQNNCHLMELCHDRKYHYRGRYGDEMICKPPGPGGIAGGCICISKQFWDLIGGYKVLGVYASDDAHLMRDSHTHGYSFLLSDTIKCIHPFETDDEYANWKRIICPNASELEPAIQNANEFWNRHNEKFSYVIPHRTATADRKRNLDYVISYINNNFKDAEVIVVEQDTEERYFNRGCTKVLYPNSGPFRRSACLNIGYTKAKYDKIIFADNDLLIPHEQIREALLKLDTYEAVNPYKNVRDLQEDITNELVKADNFEVLTSYTEREGVVFSGGACFFTKEGYAKIGGYDEEFIGWGGEDNACTHKIEQLLKHCEVDGHCWHMNHSRNLSNEVHNDYNNNLLTLRKIESLTGDELIKFCDEKRLNHGW